MSETTTHTGRTNAERIATGRELVERYAEMTNASQEWATANVTDLMADLMHFCAAELEMSPEDIATHVVGVARTHFEEELAEAHANHVHALALSPEFAAQLRIVGLEVYAERPGVQEATCAESLATALLDCAAKDGIALRSNIDGVGPDYDGPLAFRCDWEDGRGYGDLVACFTITRGES